MGEISAPYLKRNMSFSWLTCSLLLGTLCAGKRIYCRSRICNCCFFFFAHPESVVPRRTHFLRCVCMCFDPRTTLRLLAVLTLLLDTKGLVVGIFHFLLQPFYRAPPPVERYCFPQTSETKATTFLSARWKKGAKSPPKCLLRVLFFKKNTPPLIYCIQI